MLLAPRIASLVILIVLPSLAGPARAQAPLLWSLHRMLPADHRPTAAVVLGDLDGDGDRDAVLASSSTNRLYRGDGKGGFTDASSNLPPDTDLTAGLALGDADGDGDLDLFVANGALQQNRLYRNDGGGVFTDATANVPALLDLSNAVRVLDADGDGDLDAIFADAGLNRLWSNDGTGVFADGTANLPSQFDATADVATGDVDGDLDPDLLLATGSSGSGGQNRLWSNDGSGVFADATANLPVDAARTSRVALGDMDGDLDLDAYFGNGFSATGGQADFLDCNDGAGGFADVSPQLPPNADACAGVTWIDVDGDQDLDLLVANASQSALYRNDGAGTFADASGSLPPNVDRGTSLAAGDVDGDLDPDGILGTGGQDRLWLSDGTGGFSDVTDVFPGDAGNSASLSLADVEGDQDLDVWFADAGPNRLYVGDAAGRFQDASGQIPVGSDVSTVVLLADWDGDLDPDAFVGNGQPTAQNRLYQNDGLGGFTDITASSLPAVLDKTSGAAAGDVDGDGDLDILVANAGPSGDPNRLLLNDGNGGFSDASGQIPVDFDPTFAVALEDLDGDGDRDAFLGNFGPPVTGQNRVYHNDGTGVFTDVTSSVLPVIFDKTEDVAAGDLDGDLDIDLVAGNLGQKSRLYRNDGSGVFADATTSLPAAAATTTAVALGDLNGDGSTDLLLGNWGQANGLFLNDGAGTFTDASARLSPEDDATAAVALADLDGDGDRDALFANGSQDRCLANTTRHLAWRAVPRVAKPLDLDVYGPPAGAWLLLLSLAPASVPLPYGILRLDPATLLVAGSGILDGQGFASLPLAVPANPGLVGASLYGQAVFGFPLSLSNLERMTFTAL